MTTKSSPYGHGWPVFDFKGLIAGYDTATLTQASTTDTYKWYQGGTGGTLLSTMTITYTDSTKATVSQWALS